MNTSNAFRSHLMQGFLAQARTQSRPPLALLGLFSDENEQLNYLPQIPLAPKQPRYVETNLSSIRSSFRTQSRNVKRRHTDSEIRSSRTRGNSLYNNNLDLSSVKFSEAPASQDTNSLVSSSESGLTLSQEFQNMLQARRVGTKRLTTLKELPPMYESDQDFWISAIDRAVKCGHATSRKKTDPFTFKRIVAPSKATERLAEIAYQVDLRQNKPEQDKKAPQNQATPTATERAERKRAKVSQTPAFLVTTVSEDSLTTDSESVIDEYEQLPYSAPQTEEALENYAAACAAIQNAVLSLRSEKINAKWTKSPVIRTKAFRDLIHAESNDRVVGLIMVGDTSVSVPKARRHQMSERSGSSVVAL